MSRRHTRISEISLKSLEDYEPVIGIDLGTTYCCVGLVNKDGSVEILTDDEGRKTSPSVITFSSEYHTEVGHDAYSTAESTGSTLIYDVKRLIGRKFSTVTSSANWPF